jgi:hypothetical protein
MAYGAAKAEVVIHAADETSDSTSTINVVLGDGTLPSLEEVFTKAAAIGDDVRGFTNGALNRIDGRVRYTDPAAGAAAAGSEVERKAVIKMKSSAGIVSQISIPGVAPAFFVDGKLNTGDTDVAALLDALTTGIGGVIPVDSHGDEIVEIVDAYKRHRSSFKG